MEFEINRKIEIIQISGNTYRLSGCFKYESREYKSLEVNGEIYNRYYFVEKTFDIDLLWENRIEFFDDHKIGREDDEKTHKCKPFKSYKEWQCYSPDFVDFFDIGEILLFVPNGFNWKYIIGTGWNDNEYISMMFSMYYAGCFKDIKGTMHSGRDVEYDPNIFNINLEHYGWNNSLWFSMDFKSFIQYDILKLSERLRDYNSHLPRGHSKIVNKIIKDYYQKTGSIDDADRVNILSNYIGSMTA